MLRILLQRLPHMVSNYVLPSYPTILRADQHFQLPGCSSPRLAREGLILSWKNEDSQTALELAARLEKLECARLLVRAMAEVGVLLESLKSALKWAKVSEWSKEG
jgi:hypothetical protein